MRTRIIAVVLAVALAVVGAVLLVTYVRGADQRAFDGTKLTEVLVVQKPIDAGTSASTLGASVGKKSIPTAFVVPGAITDVKQLAGLVSSVALEPGEQLLSSRFVDPSALSAGGGSIAIPDGMQEITISADLERIVGGAAASGDLVGVYVSLPADGDQPARTQLLESNVLVTSVSLGSPSTDGSTVISGTGLVSLAVNGDQAQRIVFANDFGTVWLTRQSKQSKPPTGGTVTRGSFG